MKKTITIAICGVQPRVGTTTQALQIVSYLQLMGYEAAYVELADQGYLNQLRKLYSDITVEKKCIRYERISMYRSIIDVNGEEPYDFLVKDYGSMDQENFNQVSYLEQDLQIICAGVKPNEIFKVTDILRREEYYPAKIIFSFVPSDQKADFKKFMENRAKDTFFANFTPDPFSLDVTMNKTYRSLMGSFLISGNPSKKKKFYWKEKLLAVKNRTKIIWNSAICKGIGLVVYTVLVYFIVNSLK